MMLQKAEKSLRFIVIVFLSSSPNDSFFQFCKKSDKQFEKLVLAEVDDDDETTKLKSAVWHNSNPQKDERRSFIVELVVLSRTSTSASLPSSPSLLNSLRDAVDENMVKFC